LETGPIRTAYAIALWATVRERDDPSLIDKPVIVGGGKRGVVAAGFRTDHALDLVGDRGRANESSNVPVRSPEMTARGYLLLGKPRLPARTNAADGYVRSSGKRWHHVPYASGCNRCRPVD
jgi:hypothetical protein